MELDEAIKHAEEVANEKEKLGSMGRGNPDKYALSPEQCFKCAEDHRQLAEWLKELKRFREEKQIGGEWIPDDELTFDPARPWWKCPKCGERTGIRTKYCPECGKRNRRSKE